VVEASIDVGTSAPWWRRPGLEVRDGRLSVAGRDAEALAREHGTPLFAYDLRRIREQVTALRSAYERVGLRSRVRLALKAQREPAVLRFLRGLAEPGSAEAVGMDVCSPGEVELALEHGWRPEEISYTGHNVSERDLDVILSHPGMHVNVDLLTQIERFGRRAPGSTIGLRVNPRAGAAYRGGADSKYASARKVTKFGILEEQLDDAAAAARRHDLTIDTVHFHVGDGFLDDGLLRFERAVETVAAMTRRLLDAGCPIAEVNTGGGLGVPIVEGDRPLDLDAYAGMLARHLGPLDVVVAVEPGDFLAKESGVLLVEVVTVEERAGVTFVGVDAGWNVLTDRFIYGGPQTIVPCRAADAPRTWTVTVSGHINEGDDLFEEDLPMAPVAEGDVLAILNAGSYAQSMEIVHCLRGPAPAVFFPDRLLDEGGERP
jgi:diaminopimelate decarboxylase